MENFTVSDENTDLFDHIKVILREHQSGKSGLDTFVRRAEDSKNKLPVFKTNKIEIELQPDLTFITSNNSKTKYKLSKGLIELLFAGKYLDNNNVNTDDFKIYKEIVGELNTKKIKSYGEQLNKEGDGLITNNNNVITIPSNVKELHKRLKILIAAYKEGHKDTYNEINGILKELLNQNEINEKQYKFILSSIR